MLLAEHWRQHFLLVPDVKCQWKRIHEEIPAQCLAQQQRSTSTAQDSCSELKNAMTASNRCPPSLMLHENDAATLVNTAASTVSCSLTKQLLPSSWTTFNEHQILPHKTPSTIQHFIMQPWEKKRCQLKDNKWLSDQIPFWCFTFYDCCDFGFWKTLTLLHLSKERSGEHTHCFTRSWSHLHILRRSPVDHSLDSLPGAA